MNEIWNEIQILQTQMTMMAVGNILLGVVTFLLNRSLEKVKAQLKKTEGEDRAE